MEKKIPSGSLYIVQGLCLGHRSEGSRLTPPPRPPPSFLPLQTCVVPFATHICQDLN